MDNRPIGVFDSGLGGLTAVKELSLILPNENIIYFGDTGRVPYGTRGKDIIKKYARQDMDFLKSKDVKMIIVACGTVSSVAADVLAELSIPWVEVVSPAAAAAARATANGKIGVIGTAATIGSGAFEREILAIKPDAEVISRACPMFVPLVENGMFEPEDKVALLLTEKYLLDLKDEQIDTLILGCTHFPLLAPVIRKVMGENVSLIDSGREAAKRALEVLEREDLLNLNRALKRKEFYVSDKTDDFSEVASIFLGENIKGEVFFINLDN